MRKRNIAIIPARSGSKGLIDKNIKELAGKPLIAYAIEAARESGLYNTIFLSTDSIKYAEIGKKYGAEVPFLREQTLSIDNADSWDVVRDVINHLAEEQRIFDTITLLQPTSPLRTAIDICDAMQLFNEKNAGAVVSVCETEHSPLWENVLPEDRNMRGFVKSEIRNRPRQQLPMYYRLNGAIYIVRANCLNKVKDIYENNCYAYIMDRRRSVDIDNALDFYMAEFLFKQYQEKKESL